ncbi:hypothetical protein [Vibrio alfacsensis]|uniref:hypothetical protein n=1 Tax=Vibrio TaxID=662 RepID=UPI004067A269
MQKLQSEALKVLFENLSYNGGFAVINPATEQDLIRLKTSALEDIDAQLVACKHAQVEWFADVAKRAYGEVIPCSHERRLSTIK